MSTKRFITTKQCQTSLCCFTCAFLLTKAMENHSTSWCFTGAILSVAGSVSRCTFRTHHCRRRGCFSVKKCHPERFATMRWDTFVLVRRNSVIWSHSPKIRSDIIVFFKTKQKIGRFAKNGRIAFVPVRIFFQRWHNLDSDPTIT